MTIQFNAVNYTYEPGTPFAHKALFDVTTTFEDGKYYAIIGETGSGKSTLIQHFNGLLKPTTGSVLFQDLRITQKTKENELHQYRKQVGIVFQFPESQLFEDSVEREVLFGPKNFNMDVDKARQRALDLLLRLGFSHDVLSKSPFQMSGGQMRKIAIVSILVMDPDMIILDEPTAGLDPKSRFEVMTLFKELQLEGKTIILISHDMNDVAYYAEQVKILKNGRLIQSVTPEHLFKNREMVASLNIALPDIVKLQYDLEDKYGSKLPGIALDMTSFVKMYKKWVNVDER